MSAEVKSMKEWALYYAELGLAVFPLAYRNKVPAIEGGCKAATTEKSKIERWWNQNPRYNIGIATGNKSNGLVVIDLDVDKNKGIDGYAVERFPMNDRGSADLFATIFKNVSRYNPTKKDWMYYDKTRWTADTEGMRAKRNAKMLADVLVRYYVHRRGRKHADATENLRT